MKPHTLSIDIETYSSVDITKCGVYRYVEADDFGIILFAYSLDYGPVQLVDMLCGEEIPEEILGYIWDPDVEKTAYNANFERTCIGRYYGRYCEPEQWSCTMVLAASCGLPLKLASVGAALELPEDKAKMKEGSDLIRYFCQPCRPTKANGMRTRNYPENAPDKWEVFRRYNIRDVEVENTIRKMLLKWRPDYTEQRLWCLDQRMNDAGVRIEPKLAENAIRIGNDYREKLLDRAKEISGLENPNSNEQVKNWLREQEDIEVLSLNKKAVADVVSNLSSNATKELMKLREEFSKSSTKKYEAFLRCKCKDDHIRGLFQFYGASTGRWCLTGDHEVLTKDGWVRLDEWSGGSIAVWNASSEAVSFQKSEVVSFDYEGDMYHWEDVRIDQVSTPDHKMRVQKRKGYPWFDATVEEMSSFGHPRIPIYGYKMTRGCANPFWFRVLIMTQADGYYTDDGQVCFHFKKKRKIERCKFLLRKAGISFVVNEEKNCTSIAIPARFVPLWLREFRSKTFGYWLFDENPDIFFDELPYWDGYYPAPNSIQYTTCNKTNADIVQALAHMSGRCANIKLKEHSKKNPNWQDAYVLDIGLNVQNNHEMRTKPTKIPYSGKVYCASTPTGYFLVRRNGKVWVTGNSGRNVQIQNLPHDTLDDLDDARDMVLIGDAEDFECLYPKVQKSLSALIRTTLIPEDDSRLIVADFSAIEARVIAWIANETWRIESFANGKDIYCESASRAFKIPVVKHGINGDKRAYGKIIELACIAEDQVVYTDHGLVPIQNVTREMKVWDGESFVSHDGVVSRGRKLCIGYCGLVATPDHRVYVKDRKYPISMQVAAKLGLPLVGYDLPVERPLLCGTLPVYDILNAGPKHRYTVEGRLVHNCGYGGSVGAMKNFGADKMGMTEEEMVDLVDKWREASPKIVALWKSLESTAMKCIRTGKPQISTVGNIRFDMEDGSLFMSLPSGRRIAYWGAEIQTGKNGKPAITYMAQNQTTKKWERTETFSGRLAENCTQATARDCLKEALFNLADAGYDVRATIHDEVIITAPNDFGSLEEVIRLMCKGAPWMEGLPLNADGYYCSSYRKE